MTTSTDSPIQMVYEHWMQAAKTLLAFQWKLYEVQCQTGMKILQGAFPSETTTCSPGGELSITDEVARLERLATARVSQGFAPPREIYQIPYRNRIDWGRFPEWVRPSDPELFEGSAHEG
jgi:hypothetical protein